MPTDIFRPAGNNVGQLLGSYSLKLPRPKSRDSDFSRKRDWELLMGFSPIIGPHTISGTISRPAIYAFRSPV